MNNNFPQSSQSSDLELLTHLLREKIEESGELSKTELGFLFDDMYIYSVENGVATVAVANEFMRDYYSRKNIDEFIKRHLAEMLELDELEVEVFVDPNILPPPQMQMFDFLQLRERQEAKKLGMTVEQYRQYKKDLYNSASANNGDLDDMIPDEDGGFDVGTTTVSEDESGAKRTVFVPADEIVRRAKEEILSYKEEYTFENFIVGDSNNVAAAFAKLVAETPGDKKNNPLYIYGPPGVGKTHLAYAIANKMLTDSPDKKIEYVRGEDFVNLFIEMIRENRGDEFREKYRKADMLIIDDIQFIEGKTKTEEELFHTFNTLFDNNRQIVFTADKLPKDMPNLSRRLESRMEGGVMADIQLPSYELRLAILRNKAMTSGLDLSGEVEDFLATRLTSSIRQIEGVVKKLSGMRSFLEEEDLTVETVCRMVPEYLTDTAPIEEVVQNVIAACADYYSVRPEDLIGEKRDRNIQSARNAAMYIIRVNTNLSTKSIGAIFGGRKHTTVISNFNTVKKMIEEKPSFAAEIEQMTRNSKTQY